MPLLVVTKDPMSVAIKQLCQQLKIQQKVVWKNNVDTTHQLKAVYQAAKALIYPSLYEGFGLPIVEAMLCKTPVLCSGVSSMPEAAGPDSWYFNPHQVDDIAACIQSFIQQKTNIKTRVEQSYNYAMQQFSPQNIALQWMRLYRNLHRS
jgi:glycosyltransferase involved in cell wall biosynthesis